MVHFRRALRIVSVIAFVLTLSSVSNANVSASETTATLTGGGLSITGVPANFAYPTTALTGSVITLNLPSAFAVTVNDSRGTGAGWHLLASIDVPLTSGANSIPAANHTVTAVAVTGVTGTAPTNSTGYPYVFPTTASKLFTAALATGRGNSTETFSTQLVIPADAAAGTYSQVLTITIATGP